MTTALYKDLKNSAETFYLLETNNVVIHGNGIIAKNCGFIQSLEACETLSKHIGKRWYTNCQNGILKSNISWVDAFNGSKNSVEKLLKACPKDEKYATPIKRHKKVFIITAEWDSNYHHFMVDSLTRYCILVFLYIYLHNCSYDSMCLFISPRFRKTITRTITILKFIL